MLTVVELITGMDSDLRSYKEHTRLFHDYATNLKTVLDDTIAEMNEIMRAESADIRCGVEQLHERTIKRMPTKPWRFDDWKE